jgi:DNA-binding NtrC family response regulator
VGGQDVHVDVRVVAATHRDLSRLVAEGRFRADLFYRLSVAGITLPPLRARMDDLPLLVDHLLDDLKAPPLGSSSMKVLEGYDWPGNVRQLRNVLERAVALSRGGAPSIEGGDLGLPAAQLSPSHLLQMPFRLAKEEMLARFTREYLEALLARSGGNVSEAARTSKVDRNWIVALAKRHGVRLRG